MTYVMRTLWASSRLAERGACLSGALGPRDPPQTADYPSGELASAVAGAVARDIRVGV
jgi:hypothetical protein